MPELYKLSRLFYGVLAVVLIINTGLSEQIAINRVEQMPNLPSPYLMRNWKQVALGYDSLVFDLNRSGQHLPLVWINTNTINYPNHNSFGLHTVVGTPYPSNAEAINILPAVISASLVGIDKRNQHGINWVLGCEEFFNRRPDENVYLNGPTTQSGDDWWYSMMPNVFFYQLYDLYPETGDFAYQFTSVADQWLRAVEAMGGSATPWKKASMNYRGWYLSTMTPYTSGVKEPESAGSIAWILYNAFVETGDTRYRRGAEWALEFLSAYSNNAAYELQLPYGVYAAARMNAELGTTYNVEKMLNWCFNPEGNVRDWGVTLRNWGEYDCHGLVGEEKYNNGKARYEGYAFVMNGYEMAAALVPMLRYDDRFARAIGKWVLNMANASRLFYSPFLPDSLQDGELWAKEHDPNGCIAHESMREFAQYTGVSPYATGDAVEGNWGATNFALYGSSHVGIMGGIIDTTEVGGILRLDLRKTDFFQDDAYPSYLFYNPHNEYKTASIDAGSQAIDIYDAVTNQFVAYSVSGTTSISIPADAAIIAVLIPAAGTLTYEDEKMLVDGIIADYNSGQSVGNHAPRIKAVAADSTTILFNQSIAIYCTATDRDADVLVYSWSIGQESLGADSTVLIWTAPETEEVFTIACSVSDGVAEVVSDSIRIEVIYAINHAPTIEKLLASAGKIDLGDTTSITCTATDPDGDSLIYHWSADDGILIGGDSIVTWIAPDLTGYYFIRCQVSDNRGGEDVDSIGILVRDFSNPQVGDPIAYYPFNGDANDLSGMNNHGIVNGAELSANRFGNANSAYSFNGTTDNIRVPVNSTLNFTEAITVSFWMNAAELYSSRESYPISHGNWENRWKVSIIPDKRIRWTVKTTDGVKDLDSRVKAEKNVWYQVLGLYDGNDIDIYINGALDNHATFSGAILTTNIDLMIGQVLPNVNQYNFKGLIDDVRIFDYALSVEDIEALYGETSAIHTGNGRHVPETFALHQNYPNPFNPQTTISFEIPQQETVLLEIYDISGRQIETLIDEIRRPGHYSVTWNSDNSSSGIYLIRLRTDSFDAVRKCIKLK